MGIETLPSSLTREAAAVNVKLDVWLGYLHAPGFEEAGIFGPRRIQREVCEYNSIKLAATPRLVTNSTVSEHEVNAPKDLYVFGRQARTMRYRPKVRPRRGQVDKETNRDVEMV